uniref:Uncharacterized protein n=1 Tax=Zea mays TaxID=4577 RepID=B6U585_MAIZE|nr:hypothetical protein [Zea mays]
MMIERVMWCQPQGCRWWNQGRMNLTSGCSPSELSPPANTI